MVKTAIAATARRDVIKTIFFLFIVKRNDKFAYDDFSKYYANYVQINLINYARFCISVILVLKKSF
jgi:hypothetical protein